MYVEDLKRGTNKDIGPKDIFEMGSNMVILYKMRNRISQQFCDTPMMKACEAAFQKTLEK